MTTGVINPEHAIALGIIKGPLFEDIQPNSIDLRVSEIYEIQGNLVLYANRNQRELPQYSPIKKFPYSNSVPNMYKLNPGHRYQIEFNAQLEIPADICGVTMVRSTMAKSGCSGENGLFDSGYRGGCGMMISVQSPTYIELDAPVAQILFFKAESHRLYNGFYQGGTSPLEWSNGKTSAK